MKQNQAKSCNTWWDIISGKRLCYMLHPWHEVIGILYETQVNSNDTWCLITNSSNMIMYYGYLAQLEVYLPFTLVITRFRYMHSILSILSSDYIKTAEASQLCNQGIEQCCMGKHWPFVFISCLPFRAYHWGIAIIVSPFQKWLLRCVPFQLSILTNYVNGIRQYVYRLWYPRQSWMSVHMRIACTHIGCFVKNELKFTNLDTSACFVRNFWDFWQEFLQSVHAWWELVDLFW